MLVTFLGLHDRTPHAFCSYTGSLSGGARRASIGNCLVCVGMHPRLRSCGSTVADMFCSGAEPPAPLVMSGELVVAVAPGAASQELWAAQQLAKWMGAMPGAARNCSAKFPNCAPAIVAPTEVGQAPAVFVGVGAAQAAGVPHAELHSLGRDAFRCSFTARSGNLVLTGGLNRTDGAEPRGTINAVFEYLRLIGFKFYTPYSADSYGQFDSTQPEPNASLPSCARLKSKPSFDYRSVSIHNLLDSCSTCPQAKATDLWWVQNHMNGGGDRTGNYISTVIPFEMGGQLMYHLCYINIRTVFLNIYYENQQQCLAPEMIGIYLTYDHHVV